MFNDEYWERLLFMAAFAIKGMREADRLLDRRYGHQLKSGQVLHLKEPGPEPEPQVQKAGSIFEAISQLLE